MVSTNTMSLGTLQNLLLLNVFNYYIYIYNYLFTHDSAWQIKQLRTRDSLFLAYDQNVWYLVSNQNLWVSAFSTLKQIFIHFLCPQYLKTMPREHLTGLNCAYWYAYMSVQMFYITKHFWVLSLMEWFGVMCP